MLPDSELTRLGDRDLFALATQAAAAGRMEDARRYRRLFREARRAARRADEERLAASDRALARMQAEAAQRGNRCDLTPQGCTCRGMLDYSHHAFLEELRKPAVTAETRGRVAALLGYPPDGKRMKAIFGGTRDGGPVLPGFEWAAGALEEDWLELLEIAERAPGRAGGPLRNPRDGSVRDGWVKAVLGSVIARHRKAKHNGGAEIEQEQVATSGAEIH